MKQLFLSGVVLASLLGIANKAGADEWARKRAEERAWATRGQAYMNQYNPAYGYSTGHAGRGTYYGNSAPYQGNFRFPPGFGYGSIYGNSGHPGFGTYRGPAWGHRAAWGW